MRTFPTLLSRTSLYFCRILLLTSTLLTVGTTNSCSQQGQNKETTGSSAETDSTEARQLAQEETFLANKAKEPDVKSLGGGLLYKVLHAGNGAQPTSTSTVTVDYEGKLIDGTIFDSSYQRGESASFPVSGVVPGW